VEAIREEIHRRYANKVCFSFFSPSPSPSSSEAKKDGDAEK
jgi:hypothetical protein